MSHTPGKHAAEQLEHAQTQLTELQRQEDQIRQQIGERCSKVAQQIKRSTNSLPAGDTGQRPLPELLQEATVLETGAKYLEGLEVHARNTQSPADTTTSICLCANHQVQTSLLAIGSCGMCESSGNCVAAGAAASCSKTQARLG